MQDKILEANNIPWKSEILSFTKAPRATLSPPMALLVDYQTKITLNMLFTHSQNGLNIQENLGDLDGGINITTATNSTNCGWWLIIVFGDFDR